MQIKPQEIRAGGFVLKFIAPAIVEVSNSTEGRRVNFNDVGDVLTIEPVKVSGEPFVHNKLAPANDNKQAETDGAAREAHNGTVDEAARKA